ncbi:MAG TPA: DNA repair protein RecN, partial [Thermoanaerobaculia bacterium]|nr:DNA repair protein RecN [Thermoanaerobaculia bacterium]
MLREIHVRNLAVMAEASVELGDGLNILSGETGAGKSIIVDSLSLLSGARASADMIRSDADALTVSGVFELQGDGWRPVLEGAGLEAEGDEVLVRREIARSGRNRVFVNDQPTTLRLLSDLAPFLLRIHGQRDELGLIEPELQRKMLDQSGGAEAEGLRARVAAAFDQHHRLAERLERLSGDDRARRERIDLLRFHAAEIDAARLRAGEEIELRSEREVLRHAEAITRALGTAFSLLSEEEGSAVERLAKSQGLLAGVEAWEPQAVSWNTELEELRIRLAELAGSLNRRLDGLEADPARLDVIEERLAILERLARKHGGLSGDTAAVLARRTEIEAELAELEGDAENKEELEVRVAAALAEYREAAAALSQARERWGKALVERIEGELQELGLARARLAVALERRRRADGPLVVDGQPIDCGREGIDQVVFLFAPNPGEEARPLARIASGGELSRIHLALQLGAHGETEQARPTLVFDEVDTGIGGAEAAALGRKLQRLAKGGQILAVTHLPQVAACADHHFVVSKTSRDGATRSDVQAVTGEARVGEVARMLGGERLSGTTVAHAQEMLAVGSEVAAAPRTR